MEWIPYIARLATIDEVLTDEHLKQDFDVIAYESTWERGQIERATIEIPNPGIGLLAPGAKMFVAVMESADKTIANARVLMRGRIVPLIRTGADMTNARITLSIEAAPADVKNTIFSRAVAIDMVKPYFDELVDDLSFDKPENALLGRSATYFCDPVTHAVTVEDIIDSSLPTVDIGSQSDFKTHKLSTILPPVARAMLKLQAEWDQTARTLVNIAGPLTQGNGLAVSTLDVAHFEPMADRDDPGKLMNWATGGGWKQDRTQAHGTQFKSNSIPTGRQWQTTQVSGTDSSTTTAGPDGSPITVVTQAPRQDLSLDEFARFWVTAYKWNFHWMLAEYTQQRRETVTLYCDMPVQTIQGVNAKHDMGTLSAKDLLTWDIPNPTPPPEPDPNGDYVFPYSATIQVAPHDPLRIYLSGDVVSFGGLAFQCTADNTVGYLYGWGAGSRSLTPTLMPGWEAVPWGGPLPDTRLPFFFQTPRGQLMMEHGVLRMRAFLRARLQAQAFEFGTDWETGWSIDGRREVRATYYDYAAGVGRPVRGKVKARKLRIDASKKWVTLTLGLCLGTGQDTPLAQVGPTAYSGQVVSAASWFQNIQGPGGNIVATNILPQLVSIYTFEQGYPLDKLGTYAIGDVAWTYGAEPLVLPVDAFQLGNASYAVYSVQRFNESGVQLGYCAQYGAALRDPRNAVRDFPTRVDVTMRNIQSSGVLERDYHAVAYCATSPRGIDLVNGGEP